MPQMSKPKAIRSVFFVLMLHGLSQPALADNGESLRPAEELKSVVIRVDLCSYVTALIWLAFFEQSHNRSSKNACDNHAHVR
jgi:hypothetical protein